MTDKILAQMENEISRADARRIFMRLLANMDFKESTDEFKAECYAAVFYALELLKD